VSDTAAKSVVLVAGGLMFAAIAIRRSTIPDPMRFAWAAGAILLFLSLLSDISPQVAGPAAILVLMAVYWRNRGVIGGATPLGGSSTPASSSSSSGAVGPHAAQAH